MNAVTMVIYPQKVARNYDEIIQFFAKTNIPRPFFFSMADFDGRPRQPLNSGGSVLELAYAAFAWPRWHSSCHYHTVTLSVNH